MASAADSALERLSQVERPVRLAVELMLIVLIGMIVARLVWLIASPSESVASFTDRPLPSPMQGGSNALAVSTDRTILLNSNPFSQSTSEIIVEEVPETNLNLRLVGLRMSTDGNSAGNAIIRTPDGIGKNYSIGDEILAGVQLNRILSDRVIINRDGVDETLMLGGRSVGLSVISDDSQSVPPEAASEALGQASAVLSAPDVIEGQVSGPDAFFGAVNAGPVIVNGQTTGYRLTTIGNGEVMRQAGLQSGDILQQINGASVANLDMSVLIERFSAMETVELTINRDGSQRTVRLSFIE